MLATLLFLFWAESAEAVTVALLRPTSSAQALREALFRLQGELLAVGLDVAVVARPTELALAPRAALERLASERDLDAVIDVIGESTPEAVEIWIFRPRAHLSEVPRVLLDADVRDPAETLAIRAIEVLRSRFVELDLALREQQRQRLADVERRPSERPPPAPRPPASEPTARPGLAAGAAVLTSLGRVGPAILPLVRFDWAAPPWLVAEVTLAGLGTRPTLETADGTVQVSQHYGLLGLCYCLPNHAGVRPVLALSAGVLRTLLDGQADAPNQGHDLGRWSFLMDGSLGARLPLVGRSYLTLAAHVQFAEPYVAIHVVDTLVATSGRPNLLFSLTLGTWL